MGFAAKKKPEPAVSLEDRINALREEVEQFLDRKVAEVKKSRDGSGLPLTTIKHMLCRGYYERCPCQAAMIVIQEHGE